MKEDLAIALDVCLDDLFAGKSVEECLARFPEYRTELEPLLHLATMVDDIPLPQPRPEAIDKIRGRLGLKDSWWHRLASTRPQPAVVRAIAAGLATVVLTWSVTVGAAGSSPGDFLYPVKLITERVTFAITTAPDQRAELRLTFADRRLNELVASVQQTGTIDPGLLKILLEQAELALDDADPLPENRYAIMLSKINHFNSYQKDVLERLSPGLSNGDRTAVKDAISVCDERERWMRDMWKDPEAGKPMRRGWGSRCRCK